MAELPGARLRAIRKLFGISQRELAKRAGVPNSAISVIEQGAVSPSINSLEKVVEVLGITLGEFFSIDLEKPVTVESKAEPIADVGSATGIDLSGATLQSFRLVAGESLFCITPGTGCWVLAVRGQLNMESVSGIQTLEAGNGVRFSTSVPLRVSVAGQFVDGVIYSTGGGAKISQLLNS